MCACCVVVIMYMYIHTDYAHTAARASDMTDMMMSCRSHGRMPWAITIEFDSLYRHVHGFEVPMPMPMRTASDGQTTDGGRPRPPAAANVQTDGHATRRRPAKRTATAVGRTVPRQSAKLEQPRALGGRRQTKGHAAARGGQPQPRQPRKIATVQLSIYVKRRKR